MRPSRRAAPPPQRIPLPAVPCPCCGERKLVLVLPAAERPCDRCGLPTTLLDLRDGTCRWCVDAPTPEFRLSRRVP